MREGGAPDSVSYLKQGIYERQTELHNLAKVLSDHSELAAKKLDSLIRVASCLFDMEKLEVTYQFW